MGEDDTMCIRERNKKVEAREGIKHLKNDKLPSTDKVLGEFLK